MPPADPALPLGLTPLQLALLIHGLLALLALWPAVRLLARAGLPGAWALWLLVPLLGWPVFASLLAFRPWPALPPQAPRLHSRERLRRERAAREGGA